MSAFTDIKTDWRNAYAGAWNMRIDGGFRSQEQLNTELQALEDMGVHIRDMETEVAKLAALVDRPVLAEAARMTGAIGIDMRDALDGADVDSLLATRAEAMRHVADSTTLAEHIDRLLIERGMQ